jgi:hypothetical protein
MRQCELRRYHTLRLMIDCRISGSEASLKWEKEAGGTHQ